MTVVRCAAGLAAVISAMLVQATVIGPLVYPVPVSLPLLVIVGVALLCGPSTGIALGFGAGLLADLTANHPIGLLALSWLGAGVAAGIVGGLVEAHRPAVARSRSFRATPMRSELSRPGARTERSSRRRREDRRAGRIRRRAIERARAGSIAPSQWRAQAMLTGLVAAAGTAVGLILIAVVGGHLGSLPAQLVQLIPAVLIDAILAVPIMAMARGMIASAALRPVQPARLSTPQPAGPVGRTTDRPMEFV